MRHWHRIPFRGYVEEEGIAKEGARSQPMSNILLSQSRTEYADVLKHLAANLRRFRDRSGWSQTALAERSGLSRRMISAIESGTANVSLSSIDRLAAALSVTFAQMVLTPDTADGHRLASVVWRGGIEGSKGVLLGAVPSSVETEFWEWTLASGERFEARASSDPEREMIYVLEGALSIEDGKGSTLIEAGNFLAFENSGVVLFANNGQIPVRYIRVLAL
jgi:transcriptional regulator with XRE-family HTH domain